jgi:hypothetical protein
VRITFVVTIDPVKDLHLLSLLVHSLNLQTCQAFDVVFYNQTLLSEDDILSRLSVRPRFPHRFFGIDREDFCGDYPMWDLYGLHATLLERRLLNDYFMALHIEEFPDVDYVEHALRVLEANRFDIMFGNMTRTHLTYDTARPILDASTGVAFDRCLERAGVTHARHWGYPPNGPVAKSWSELQLNLTKLLLFRFRSRLRPTAAGYVVMRRYLAEDVYFMKRAFAERYNWFLRGHRMYFEDIHICEQEGVCELGRELERITRFPVYFNRRRIYHMQHGRRYYQLVDEGFTSAMLKRRVDDPILVALQEAIRMYASGQLSLERALKYTRQNPKRTGTQDLNYAYHMMYLRDGNPESVPEDAGRRP